MLLFALIALCAVFFAIPALRSPPPGFESKKCPGCKKLNKYNVTICERCGRALEDQTVQKEEESQGKDANG